MYKVTNQVLGEIKLPKYQEMEFKTAKECAEFCRKLQQINEGFLIIYEERRKNRIYQDGIFMWNSNHDKFINKSYTWPEEFNELLHGGLIMKDEEE